MFALSLALVLSTEKVTDRIYTYDKNIFTSNESFFAAIVIMSIISIVGIGVGKLVWIFYGGNKLKEDLAALQSVCLSPDVIENVKFCHNCSDSVVLYNLQTNDLESGMPDSFNVVNRLSQAEYVACIDSSTLIKDICSYEGIGGASTVKYLKYEMVTLRIYSLVTGKQLGRTAHFEADPPNCPASITNSGGVSYFPAFTKVSRELIYQ
ncbi:MAG: hypothetical protein KKD28_05025, partial [Chloroflexi bacterium]|nr:hypothetical protein [Chloroflexota bacterium]